ncbi:hypothetical protein SBA5_730002 [Candidatus Sulfotelmatomonas gaucii]|uniref:Uncharacterized protein n=1 Tax=Candidatus Sulfuritelmatomonas gaucii TaxID=2043161 RepID=A0A2N9M3J9_9BACT|nr:hypothetical protein SBA5_730002 [Candidatus Sulfotelmatomonas gaucii]
MRFSCPQRSKFPGRGIDWNVALPANRVKHETFTFSLLKLGFEAAKLTLRDDTPERSFSRPCPNSQEPLAPRSPTSRHAQASEFK